MKRYLFEWNAEHYLWFIIIDAVSLLILHYVQKRMSINVMITISVILLLIGCIFSTWSPLVFGKSLRVNASIYRNMFFFGFPYVTIGCYFAREHRNLGLKECILGLLMSFILEAMEAWIFVIYYNTGSTYMWMSTFPLIFFLFGICLMLEDRDVIRISEKTSVLIRKMSTLIYVSHNLFIIIFRRVGYGPQYFGLVLTSTLTLSAIILFSQKKVHFLKYLY